MLNLVFRMIVRGPSRRKDHKTLARIITNYFQLIYLVLAMDLKWPYNVNRFLVSISFPTTAAGDIFQTDCYFQSGKNSKLLIIIVIKDLPISKFLIGAISFACLPFVIGVFVFLFWFLLRLHNPEVYKAIYIRNTMATMTVVIFMCYPTITNYTFE